MKDESKRRRERQDTEIRFFLRCEKNSSKPAAFAEQKRESDAQQAARQHLRASARLLTLHTAACRWDAHPMVRETRAFAQWVGDGCSRAARDFLGMLRISEKMI